MKISRRHEIEDVSSVLNTEKVGEKVEIPAVDGVTYFIYTKDGKVVISSDPYRRDYVSYQDFCVVKEHLIEAFTEKEELKLKLEARFYQLADTIGRAQLAENRIANAEVQVEELKKEVERLTDIISNDVAHEMLADARANDLEIQLSSLRTSVVSEETVEKAWERAQRMVIDHIACEIVPASYCKLILQTPIMPYEPKPIEREG